MNEVVQQLYSLTQVVWKMHGHIYSGGGVQQVRGTPENCQFSVGSVAESEDSLSSVGSVAESEDSRSSEGCEFGGDFLAFC